MGSAQSARRIQPGGGPGRAGGPADLSRSPCLPTPPPALPPPLAALPSISRWRWAVGGWWGWEGGARLGSAGDRPLASCHRLWDGWKGQQGRWLWGLLRHGGGSITAKCYSPPPPVPPLPPAAALAESRGQGSQTCRCALSPPNTPHCGSRRVFWGAAPPRARPLSHPGPRADCPQCALGRSYHRAGGLFFGHAGRGSEHTGLVVMSATHPTYLETRTKESNTCTSQGLAQKPPWCNEGEGRLSQQPRWDPEASPVCQGSTTGLSHPLRWGGGVWSHVLGPERW